MPSRSSSRFATIAAGLLLAVVLLAFLTQMLPRLERQAARSAGTPVPFGTRAAADIELRPGAQVCQPNVAIDPAAATATIAVRPRGSAPTPALELTLSGASYRERARVAGGSTTAAVLAVPIDAPRQALIGTACVRNAGSRPVVLSGSGDPRVLTRLRASVDGTKMAAAFILTFEEDGSGSALGQLPELIDRAATLSAVGPWLYWLLLVLIVLGVPLAVAGALLLALRTGR